MQNIRFVCYVKHFVFEQGTSSPLSLNSSIAGFGGTVFHTYCFTNPACCSQNCCSFVSSSCFTCKVFSALTETCYADVETGEMGGVYHTVMSLMDSVMSMMDSWNCRKKEDCCPHCSCLVCRNPRFL